MHQVAINLNETLRRDGPFVFGMLSELGRELYYPNGILTQTAEAGQKATRYNATIGIAKENGQAMHLGSVMYHFAGVSPDELFPYAPSPGLPELRNKWKDLLFLKNPSLKEKAFSLPVVTSGITHGLSMVADMFVERGDLVLVPEMHWGDYNMIFGVRRGATVVRYPFFAADAQSLDTDAFRRTVLEHSGAKKIIVVLNFPNNATGYSPTRAEAGAISEALVEAAETDCDVLAVCDDAYFGLFHEADVLKESVFAYLADRHEDVLAIKLDGATVEDYAWGFRTGFITFSIGDATPDTYDALERKAAGLIRGTISNCPHHSDSILLRAMSDGSYERERQDKLSIMKARAAKVKEVLSQDRFATVWKPYPFNSGCFMCLRLNGIDAEAYRQRLLDEFGIGVIAAGEFDIGVAFSCIEENEIAPLFDAMFQCARAMKF